MNCNEFQQRLEQAIESHGPTANEVAAFARHSEGCEAPECARRWADHERLAAATNPWRLSVPSVDLVNQVVGELRELPNAAASRPPLVLRATYAAVREPAANATVRSKTNSSRGSMWAALASAAVAMLLTLSLMTVSQPTAKNTAAVDKLPPAVDRMTDGKEFVVPATDDSSASLGQTYASMPLNATEFVTDAVVLVVPADLSESDEEPTRADVWADRLGQRLEPIGRELSSVFETLMHAVPDSST